MKTLIAYFSYSGNTQNLIERLNKRFNFDVVRIERKVPYSDDYNTCAYKEAKEEVEKRLHPAVKDIKGDLLDYDRILLFFPIWWYTYPMPIATFIEKLKGFKGDIIAFANSYTNDPQYMINSMRDLKAIDKNLNIKEGLFNKSVKDHIEFLNNIN